jgi:hypothetical protein
MAANEERLAELKKIGWKNMTAEQRKEFQALELEEEKVIPPEEQYVSMKRSELHGLIIRLDNLEKANKSFERSSGVQIGDVLDVEKTQRKHTATFKKWREDSGKEYMIAIDWQYHKDEWNDQERSYDQIYNITFRKADGKTVIVPMSLSNFAKISDTEIVTILNRDVKVKQKITGFTRSATVDDDYVVKAGDKVPTKVTWEEVMCTVQLPNGDTFEINENRLNA